MTDSLIKWVGGKSKLRRKVIERLPKDAECYAEVFSGAAWVLFAKEPHPVEVLNDANGDLVNLWRVLKWRPAKLLEEIQSWLYSREMYEALRLEEASEKDELSRAVHTYLMVQMAFGGDLSRSRSAAFGFRKKARGALFLKKSLSAIFPAAERLQNVFVEKGDFADILRRYDQPKTIFFCDPPYLDTCGYAVEFSLADHCRLAGLLRGIEGWFLLTINDHPHIRKLYSGCFMEEATEARAIARASSGRAAAPILFISNYDTAEQTGDTKETAA